MRSTSASFSLAAAASSRYMGWRVVLAAVSGGRKIAPTSVSNAKPPWPTQVVSFRSPLRACVTNRRVRPATNASRRVGTASGACSRDGLSNAPFSDRPRRPRRPYKQLQPTQGDRSLQARPQRRPATAEGSPGVRARSACRSATRRSTRSQTTALPLGAHEWPPDRFGALGAYWPAVRQRVERARLPAPRRLRKAVAHAPRA